MSRGEDMRKESGETEEEGGEGSEWEKTSESKTEEEERNNEEQKKDFTGRTNFKQLSVNLINQEVTSPYEHFFLKNFS